MLNKTIMKNPNCKITLSGIHNWFRKEDNSFICGLCGFKPNNNNLSQGEL